MSRYVLETGMIKPPDPKDKKDKTLKSVEKEQSQKRNFAQANQSPISDPKESSKVESASKRSKPDDSNDSPSTKGLSSKVTSMRVNFHQSFLFST